jgi:hypothetical protein
VGERVGRSARDNRHDEAAAVRRPVDAARDELDGPSTADARTDAALELAIATGGAARFEPWGWVARQRARLAEARAVVAASTWEPGAFPAR